MLSNIFFNGRSELTPFRFKSAFTNGSAAGLCFLPARTLATMTFHFKTKFVMDQDNSGYARNTGW